MELVLRAEDFIYSFCYGLQEWILSKSHHIICWSAATLCCGPKSGAATLNKQLAVGSRHSWETGCVRKPVGWHLASGMGRNKSQFTFYFYCYFFLNTGLGPHACRLIFYRWAILPTLLNYSQKKTYRTLSPFLPDVRISFLKHINILVYVYRMFGLYLYLLMVTWTVFTYYIHVLEIWSLECQTVLMFGFSSLEGFFFLIQKFLIFYHLLFQGTLLFTF